MLNLQGLNPYSNGIWSTREHKYHNTRTELVLILILMEYDLRERKEREYMEQVKQVLILILLEDTLWVSKL